jgi:hypothetical protein
MHRPRPFILATLAALALFLAATSARAGEPSTPGLNSATVLTVDRTSRMFVTLAPGFSNLEFLGMAGLTVAVGGWQVTARALISDGLDFEVSPTESVNDVGLLFGRSWLWNGTRIYAQGGPVLANTVARGAFLYKEDEGFGTDVYEKLRRQTLGLGVEAGVAWDGANGGIGLAVVGDLNNEVPMFGLALTLRFGSL